MNHVPSYQSIGARQGSSRSDDKLAKLRLPQDLTGKSVLDLGCNEGYFCLEAKRRGAEHVEGIDHDARALAAAAQHAGAAGLDITFTQGLMQDLPDRQFDYVLLLSALHYIPNPAALLARIRACLKPRGTLVLEIGVFAMRNGRTVGRALRSIDERMFPSHGLLRDVWLQGYAVREIGRSVMQDGDPVPRFVFHCTPAVTNVVFVAGKGGIGKTSLVSQLTTAPVISTDELFAPARFEKNRIVPQQKRYDEVFAETQSIWKTWDRISEEPGMKAYFARTIATAVKHCDGAGVVVVEGFVVDALIPEIQRELGPGFHGWRTERV